MKLIQENLKTRHEGMMKKFTAPIPRPIYPKEIFMRADI